MSPTESYPKVNNTENILQSSGPRSVSLVVVSTRARMSHYCPAAKVRSGRTQCSPPAPADRTPQTSRTLTGIRHILALTKLEEAWIRFSFLLSDNFPRWLSSCPGGGKWNCKCWGLARRELEVLDSAAAGRVSGAGQWPPPVLHWASPQTRPDLLAPNMIWLLLFRKVINEQFGSQNWMTA